MHPLVNTVDVSAIGSTSLVLASRCVSCDRPIVGTNRTVGKTHNRKSIEEHDEPRHSLKGALQGSLLLTPGRGGTGKGGGIPSSAPQYRSSETRGGGFRVSGLGGFSPGAGMLWIGGHGSPTGGVASRRPASSMGLREKRY